MIEIKITADTAEQALNQMEIFVAMKRGGSVPAGANHPPRDPVAAPATPDAPAAKAKPKAEPKPAAPKAEAPAVPATKQYTVEQVGLAVAAMLKAQGADALRAVFREFEVERGGQLTEDQRGPFIDRIAELTAG